MLSRAFLQVSLLCLALGATAGAREPGPGRLRAWDTPNYTLIAADGYKSQYVVNRLANSERLLSKLLATPVVNNGVPTTVWIVPERVWNRYLAPSGSIAGEFVPRRFANYLLLSASLKDQRLRYGLQHEYTHLFLRTQFRGIYPLWYDEGMAELVATSDVHYDYATFMIPVYPDDGAWVPMSRLFVIDKTSPEYLDQPATSAVHRESWALVHRGLIGDTAFGAKIFAYLEAINRLVPVEEAAQESFGMSLASLDDEVTKYLRRRSYAVGRIPLEPRAPIAKVPSRALDPAEGLVVLARTMLDTGFNPRNVGELVEAAGKLEPESTRVAVLKLRLAVRDRNDAEALRLANWLEAESDAATLRGTGLALFERVRDERAGDPLDARRREQLARRAYALLDRALTAGPNDAEAAWGCALLAVRLKQDPEAALARLAAAKSRMPDHPDLAEAAARLHELRGDDTAMLPELQTAVRYTSSVEQRAWAAKRILELRISQKEKAPQ